MRKADIIPSKIFTLPELIKRIAQWRAIGKTVAFTNGVFDIMHRGHIYSLSQAAREADYLIVGLNSDASTKRLKGDARPVNDEQARSTVMAALLMVDAVVLFEEDTPLELIKAVMPDVLVKGGDYTEEQIVGAKEVKANGGKVVINPIVEGYSTTGIIGKINQL
ncbi:D-glycero-beta-D-manno-heptose 1-phosphate adenylyltransferase [Pseudoflavitalea sp. X16]|uniref:D-glycero-beta-D-manno-heptose 1-phosphate adenylyltransferase n=1 Tax=Paraflavitalea devenefica TaxID=2716334 RepID=UPI00141DD930|nr:D-glycero-beta-D-manno-heptose 1-phosphate adenylyltransferase [Paraflavitalea devenefica]NII26761.1 D-glycero-beta-D-manno-heptose 1-phosphate adenylyltransferase [Paraflavitalea devenefica]